MIENAKKLLKYASLLTIIIEGIQLIIERIEAHEHDKKPASDRNS